ncbi:pyruvate kinase-like isoform X1 [Pieris brassicae]|uniref:pyruvate kinase-like isoform X1 n=1 Tax=Pieris brassicae TaxID=7116 RepID=UPI001E6607F0|nr:pyruvate kinase-like isoform X1 [Pieris brassicae]
MVWWVDKYSPSPDICRSGSLCFYQYQDANEEDRVFPSTNIIFNFYKRRYISHDLYSLIKSGVNIFNIDRTEHDEEFFKETFATILKAKRIPEMFRSEYEVPITISVTFSINKPIPIEDGVDVIIIKHVNNLNQYLKLKKDHAWSKKTILLWFNKWDDEDVEQLIQFSDGVILDHQRNNLVSEEYCDCALKFCKKYFKPVFYVKPNIIEDYYNLVDRDIRIISTIHDVVRNQVDGIVVTDNENVQLPPRDIIRSIVRAISFAEKNINYEDDYLKLSFMTKIPALISITTALAACLAALKCEAKVIIVLTKSGISARWCAYASPPCPILAITTKEATTRRLHLYRKVIPLFYNAPRASWQVEWQNRVRFGTTFSLKTGLFNPGAKFVVLSASEESYCNGFQVLTAPFE